MRVTPGEIAQPRVGSSALPATNSQSNTTDLAALIRSASERGDQQLLTKLAELMINQSATRIGNSEAPVPEFNIAGAKAKVYGQTQPVQDTGPVVHQQKALPVQQSKGVNNPATVGVNPAKARMAYRQKLDDMVVRTANRYGVDPHLARAVVTAESDFEPSVLSHAGAMGLMQLMPETAKDLDVNDPWDPEQNVDGGVRYLGRMIKRFGGDVGKALMAYNWGPSNVENGGRPPTETRNYLTKVLRLQKLYAEGFSARA